MNFPSVAIFHNLKKLVWRPVHDSRSSCVHGLCPWRVQCMERYSSHIRWPWWERPAFWTLKYATTLALWYEGYKTIIKFAPRPGSNVGLERYLGKVRWSDKTPHFFQSIQCSIKHSLTKFSERAMRDSFVSRTNVSFTSVSGMNEWVLAWNPVPQREEEWRCHHRWKGLKTIDGRTTSRTNPAQKWALTKWKTMIRITLPQPRPIRPSPPLPMEFRTRGSNIWPKIGSRFLWLSSP